MKLTYSFKIRKLNKRKKKLLEKTIEEFAECVNSWLEIIKTMNGYPTRMKVHQAGYKKLREEHPNLPSYLLPESMNIAISIFRGWLKKKGKFSRFTASMISYNVQSVKIFSNFLEIPVVDKERIRLPLVVPSKFKKLFSYKHGRVQILREGKEFIAQISFEILEKKTYEPCGWLGVDLGIRHIIVVSDDKEKINKFFDSAINWKRAVEYRRAHLQSLKNRKKNIWRVLKRERNKEKNKMKDINHKIAKEIVEIAKKYHLGIAVENLSGLRKSYRAKRQRKRLHKWAYQDLIEKIKYKARLDGVPFLMVDPRNTSKTCSRCGFILDKPIKGRWFKCPKCGFQLDRDLNAARNIAKRGYELFRSSHG